MSNPVSGISFDIRGLLFSSHDYRGTATKIDAQLYKDVYQFWREQALSVQAATGANMTFTLQPIPANLSKVGIARGGNPIGIPQIDHQCGLDICSANVGKTAANMCRVDNPRGLARCK